MLAKEIYFLIWATASLIGVLTIMFIYLVIKKWIEIKKEQRITHYLRTIYDDVFAFLYDTEGSGLSLPDSDVKYESMERLLSEICNVISGESKEKMAVLANDLFTNRYRGFLQSKRWSKRMNVLFKMDSFSITTLNKDLKTMLIAEHVTKEEKLNIFRCLANTNDQDILKLLKDVHMNLSILEYRSILNRLDEEIFVKVADYFEGYSMNLKLALIDMSGIRKKIEFIPFLESLLMTEDSELRIRSMKAIGEIGFLSDSASLMHFSASPKWEERLMAAKVIGKTKVDNGLNLLSELIKDNSWNVRSQAAKAFLSYPDGLERLNKIRMTSDDRYARDMALEWSERGVDDAANFK